MRGFKVHLPPLRFRETGKEDKIRFRVRVMGFRVQLPPLGHLARKRSLGLGSGLGG